MPAILPPEGTLMYLCADAAGGTPLLFIDDLRLTVPASSRTDSDGGCKYCGIDDEWLPRPSCTTGNRAVFVSEGQRFKVFRHGLSVRRYRGWRTATLRCVIL